jgi:hypothetical protein
LRSETFQSLSSTVQTDEPLKLGFELGVGGLGGEELVPEVDMGDGGVEELGAAFPCGELGV